MNTSSGFAIWFGKNRVHRRSKRSLSAHSFVRFCAEETLLRGRLTRRISIVFPYGGSDIRNPLAESQLRSAAPRTYAYLSRFRSLLASRKELARWGGRWYPLFRIRPAHDGLLAGCLAPQSGAQAFRSAVLAPSDPAVPDTEGSSRSIRRRTGCVTRLCVSQQRQRPQVCQALRRVRSTRRQAC